MRRIWVAHGMLNMAAMLTNANLFSPELCMQYLGLQLIIGCSNDDPRMTLANFMARSVLET